jgi:hypothetical protein
MSESILNSSDVQAREGDISQLFQEFETRFRQYVISDWKQSASLFGSGGSTHQSEHKCDCEKKNQLLHDHIKTYTQRLMTVVINFEKQVKRKQNGSPST